MPTKEPSQSDERQVVSQPDQSSGGLTDPSKANLDRLRTFDRTEFEAARSLAIRRDCWPIFLNICKIPDKTE